MICEHLRPLELEIITAGYRELFRGQAVTNDSREWVYYDCTFADPEQTMLRMQMRQDITRIIHYTDEVHGMRSGLLCEACLDAILGNHRSTDSSQETNAFFT